MNVFDDDLDCERTCLGCGHEWCAQKDISPGEPDLCAGCWDASDPEAVVA